MTGTPVSGAPGTTVGSPLSDEAALERLFRTHFVTLSEEAKAHLGQTASSAAPRVVEAAFRQVWQDRQQVTTEAELMARLHETVRHCAARELSRRAAAHHLSHGRDAKGVGHQAGSAALDVDASWAHLTRLLHPEAHQDEAAAHAEALRHKAAAHVSDFSKPTSWKVPVAIGVLAIGLAGAGVWWLSRIGEERVVTRALASGDARELSAAPGQIGTLTLDDGTKVTLGAASKIRLPRQFGMEMRAVQVDGAASFAIAPGHPQPFEIRAGNAAVVATGTTIIVRAFPYDTVVAVQVRDGQATVRAMNSDESHPIADGRAMLVEKSGRVRPATADELAEATGWINRRLTIRGRQVRDVVLQLNGWYGVDIKVPELKVLDRVATVDAALDSLRAAITQVEQSADVVFGYEGQTMVFRSKQEPPAKGKR